MQLDHLILPVDELDASLGFYDGILGFPSEGPDGPFTVIRVNPELSLLLSPGGAGSPYHLAFSMPAAEFEDAMGRIQRAGIPYGDSFHSVGNMRGPGEESGARGMGPTLYVNDPSGHLLEIRHYGD